MLASRLFTATDQIRFAALSGDYNPIHLDAVVARRTQAGVPVVHGIHLLLWALDVLAASGEAPLPMVRLKASFDKFVATDEAVVLELGRRTETSVRLELVVARLKVAQFTVEFGTPTQVAEALSGTAVAAPSEPRDLAFEDMEASAGRLAFASAPENIAAMFPAASGWLGSRRIAAFAASTLLVGMVCPGLHSIYGGLSVEACDTPSSEDHLGYRVAAIDPRFRQVRLAIEGGGLFGTIESFARMPPTRQISSQGLAGVVGPTEFAGSTALVVGGSRGLGEVTAKLLAAGGAKVLITYRVGRAEAEAVAQEIKAVGGNCAVQAYDAGQSAERQLASLGEIPTHAYYFATGPIFRAQSALFARPRLDSFLSVYVDGFYDFAQAARALRRSVSLFYPSSVSISERPCGMLEYAMAKAAGENLCNEMNAVWAPLHVTVDRLPRLPTDQTASILKTESASPTTYLLPIVREVQSWPR